MPKKDLDVFKFLVCSDNFYSGLAVTFVTIGHSNPLLIDWLIDKDAQKQMEKDKAFSWH